MSRDTRETRDTLVKPAYRRFADLLYRTIGLDAASLGAHAIERAVDTRAAAWRAQTQRPTDAPLDPFYDALIGSPEELQALVETVVVPETWFFRDADAFAALVRLARGRIDARAAAGLDVSAAPLRILSLPCSTGEEPYTIAMALVDAGVDRAHFRIDAMDISARALALAQRAQYGRNSFRGNALAFRDAHFTRDGERWHLAADIAQCVRFSPANLMALDARALGIYDFVFCRNVLIYFDRASQQRAVAALESLLVEQGTLFVGPSETGLLMRYGMRPAKIPLAFAFHRASVEAARSTAAVWSGTQPVKSPNPHSAPHTAALADAAARTLSGQAPLTRVFSATPLPAQQPPVRLPFADAAPTRAALTIAPTRAHGERPQDLRALDAAQALADAGHLDQADAALHRFVQTHPPHAQAFYLLGVLADARDDAAAARGHYRKALYLDPQHAQALTHLAALLDLEGDRDGARLLMQRAARANALTQTQPQGAARG